MSASSPENPPLWGLGRVKNQHVQSAAPGEYEVVAVPVLPAFTRGRAHCGPRGSGHWGFPENNPRVSASPPFSPMRHHLRVGSHRGPLAISDSLTSWCQMQRQQTGVQLNSPWHEGCWAHLVALLGRLPSPAGSSKLPPLLAGKIPLVEHRPSEVLRPLRAAGTRHHAAGALGRPQ